MYFVSELKRRNPLLFWFGALNFVLAIVCMAIITTSDKYILGAPAFLKPLKFYVSVGIFVWTMGWLLHYLQLPRKQRAYSWMAVIVFIIEHAIVSWQAANGRTSHFNITTPLYARLFELMGIAITILTLWTGYIGYLFFSIRNMQLSRPYLWGIRLGILCFVFFAFEGGIMAAALRHTVGGDDGSTGLPMVNWSRQYGDLRVAHFFGMHALQVFPLFGYFIARKTGWLILFVCAYLTLTAAVFAQALMGLPLWE